MTEVGARSDPTGAQLWKELEELVRTAGETRGVEEALSRLAEVERLARLIRETVAAGSGRTLILRPGPEGDLREEPFDDV